MRKFVLLSMWLLGCSSPQKQTSSREIHDTLLVHRAKIVSRAYLVTHLPIDSAATILDQVAQYEVDTTGGNYILVSTQYRKRHEAGTHLLYLTLNRQFAITNSYEM